MFDFLKKKVGSFLDSIVKKDESQEVSKKEPETTSEKTSSSELSNSVPLPIELPTKIESTSKEISSDSIIEPSEPYETKPPKETSVKEAKIVPPEVPKSKETKKEALPTISSQKSPDSSFLTSISKPSESIASPISSSAQLSPKTPPVKPPQEISPVAPVQKAEPKKTPPVVLDSDLDSKKRVNIGAISTIKSIFASEITLNKKELDDLLENFELELLESDVDLSVASLMKETLNSKLSNAKIPKGKVHDYVQKVILESIIEILSNEKQFDLLEKASSSKKPFKIMLLGINGAGKTTTTAKIAHLLSKNNLKVVLCASDTFRAAAVEQLESHATALGLKIIKRDYGSDPTSVAFDATNYANAHKMDVVLIDTAGRQDTNTNLLNEMKKMSRVISPDLKLYIGESIAGSAILDQVQSFNREIGLDGVILTKLDCDPKGGTMLSLSKVTGIPIVAVTLGQKYDDIEVFDPQKIAKKIVS